MNKNNPISVLSNRSLLPLSTAVTTRHTHDCACCRLLGYADMPGHLEFARTDVYVCNEHEPDETLILRVGSSGPDYHSFPSALAAQIPSPEWTAATMLRRQAQHDGQPDWVGLALWAA